MSFLRNQLPLVGALALVVATAGCGAGGLGDILGGGTAPGGAVAGNELQGTVQGVDTRNQVVVVRPDEQYRASLRDGTDTIALHYDRQTQVIYQGQAYRPENLERGDRIVARVEPVGGRLEVEQIQVTQDVSAGPGSRDDRFAERYDDDRYHDDRYRDDRYRDDRFGDR